MREIIVLSAALAISLVGSYVVWTSEEEVIDDEAVQVYAGSADDLVSLTWESDEVTATITRKNDERGDYLWVDTVTRKKKRKATEESGDRPITPDQLQEELDKKEAAEGGQDDHGHDHGHDEPEEEAPEAEEPTEGDEPANIEDMYETEITTKSFKGSKQADELWEDFAPLFALRELAGGDEQRAAFGLDEPTGTITVERTRGSITMTVGGETFGSKDKYVSRDDQKRVFLLDDATLRPLQFAASRLTDRALTPFSGEEVRTLEVALPAGTTLAYEQQNADDSANAYWASKSDPETADETAGTWIDKLFRMRLRNYVADDERPEQLTPVFTYTASDADGDTWAVEILETTTEEGEKEWYAQSQHARALVQVPESLASGVVDDLESLTQ